MHRRRTQKILGPPKIPTPEGSSDEECEPHCSYASRKENAYVGLEVQTSHSEIEDSSDTSDVPDIEEKNKAKTPSKVKRNKQKQLKSANVDDANIKEIVREVDALMGKPAPKEPPVQKKEDCTFESVFAVRKQYLNPTEEHETRFGLEGKKNKGRNPEKTMVRNPITNVTTPFKRKGLSMSVVESKDGVTYFAYNHNPQYQQQHKELRNYVQGGRLLYHELDETPVTKAFEDLHVEGMLEAVKLFCEAEEYEEASNTLEKVIAYLQYVADPLFSITNGKTRLEYKYIENRAFFIAVLQYSYLASNRGCHRSALELIKMLLTLDPSDPLALVLVLDTFAIRAREYAWLLRAVEALRARSVRDLVNISFSYALAHFHVAIAKKEDVGTASIWLEQAMRLFPSAVMALLSNMGLSRLDPRTEKIRSHSFFNQYALNSTPKPLQEAIELYAALIGHRWNEPPVLEWLLQTAHRLCNMSAYTIQSHVKNFEHERRLYYRYCPSEVFRHRCLLKPLAKLVLDKDLLIPEYSQVTSFDPVPNISTTINRYGYRTRLCYRYNDSALQGNATAQ